MMRLYTFFIIIVFSFLSCQTSGNDFFIGTTGSRYGINPFPNAELWVDYLKKLSSIDKDAQMSILWAVGTYKSDGMKLSYPGHDTPKNNIYYSDIDYNEDYLTYFDNNDIKVYLLIEPGIVSAADIINDILERYSSHKSVAGVCVDLEWYRGGNNNNVYLKDIGRWLNTVLYFNDEYKLMVKHWNIKKIEPLLNESVVYIQSMQGITNIDELKRRHSLWVRKFYPCHVGLEVGFEKNIKLGGDFDVSINSIHNEIIELSAEKSSIYWNESTLNIYNENL